MISLTLIPMGITAGIILIYYVYYFFFGVKKVSPETSAKYTELSTFELKEMLSQHKQELIYLNQADFEMVSLLYLQRIEKTDFLLGFGFLADLLFLSNNQNSKFIKCLLTDFLSTKSEAYVKDVIVTILYTFDKVYKPSLSNIKIVINFIETIYWWVHKRLPNQTVLDMLLKSLEQKDFLNLQTVLFSPNKIASSDHPHEGVDNAQSLPLGAQRAKAYSAEKIQFFYDKFLTWTKKFLVNFFFGASIAGLFLTSSTPSYAAFRSSVGMSIVPTVGASTAPQRGAVRLNAYNSGTLNPKLNIFVVRDGDFVGAFEKTINTDDPPVRFLTPKEVPKTTNSHFWFDYINTNKTDLGNPFLSNFVVIDIAGKNVSCESIELLNQNETSMEQQFFAALTTATKETLVNHSVLTPDEINAIKLSMDGKERSHVHPGHVGRATFLRQKGRDLSSTVGADIKIHRKYDADSVWAFSEEEVTNLSFEEILQLCVKKAVENVLSDEAPFEQKGLSRTARNIICGGLGARYTTLHKVEVQQMKENLSFLKRNLVMDYLFVQCGIYQLEKLQEDIQETLISITEVNMTQQAKPSDDLTQKKASLIKTLKKETEAFRSFGDYLPRALFVLKQTVPDSNNPALLERCLKAKASEVNVIQENLALFLDIKGPSILKSLSSKGDQDNLKEIFATQQAFLKAAEGDTFERGKQAIALLPECVSSLKQLRIEAVNLGLNSFKKFVSKKGTNTRDTRSMSEPANNPSSSQLVEQQGRKQLSPSVDNTNSTVLFLESAEKVLGKEVTRTLLTDPLSNPSTNAKDPLRDVFSHPLGVDGNAYNKKTAEVGSLVMGRHPMTHADLGKVIPSQAAQVARLTAPPADHSTKTESQPSTPRRRGRPRKLSEGVEKATLAHSSTRESAKKAIARAQDRKQGRVYQDSLNAVSKKK